jgi:hypothetical protein
MAGAGVSGRPGGLVLTKQGVAVPKPRAPTLAPMAWAGGWWE